MTTSTTKSATDKAAPMIDFVPGDEVGRRVLFTPGPVTCSRTVLEAAASDIDAWGEDTFNLANACRDGALGVCGDRDDLTATLMPGSGTYAVEGAIGTFVPKGGKLLVLSNGMYGERIIMIATALGIDHEVLREEERCTFDADKIDAFLSQNPDASHVAVCHCETTTGVLNRLESVGPVVARHGKRLIVDTMATFAGYEVGPGRAIDFDAMPIDHVIASSNKCFQGIPGMCCIISRTDTLEAAEGNARSMSLDVAAQWRAMAERRRFRFTPTTHVLLALHQAMLELRQEGYTPRVDRYRQNHRVTVERFTELGFEPYIDEGLRSHINTTFRLPPGIVLEALIDAILERGFVLFPTQVTKEPTVRVGSIGAIGLHEVNALADATEDALRSLR